MVFSSPSACSWSLHQSWAHSSPVAPASPPELSTSSMKASQIAAPSSLPVQPLAL